MSDIVFMLPNIPFSEQTKNALRENSIRVTHEHYFNRPVDYFLINHGSSSPPVFGPRVKRHHILNKHDDIKFSTHKNLMYDAVKGKDIRVAPYVFIPANTKLEDAIGDFPFPYILKPNMGRHGMGALVVKDLNTMKHIPANMQFNVDYIAQTYLNVETEYRFNFIDGEIVNISKKILPAEKHLHPGVFDDWLSLGLATDLNPAAHELAKKINDNFLFNSVAVDVLKCRNDDDKVRYYFGEINTAYGVGPLTASKIKTKLDSMRREIFNEVI